jgi:hypothetical protein
MELAILQSRGSSTNVLGWIFEAEPVGVGPTNPVRIAIFKIAGLTTCPTAPDQKRDRHARHSFGDYAVSPM